MLFRSGPDSGTSAVELRQRLEAPARAAGLRFVVAERRPFARATELTPALGVPAWALSADSWTALQPRPGRGAGALPPVPRRLIWQDAPRVVWTPESSAPLSPSSGPRGAAAWLADRIVADGVEQPLPQPDGGVPCHLLRSLKRCFDPDLVLGGPVWLTEDADG